MKLTFNSIITLMLLLGFAGCTEPEILPEPASLTIKFDTSSNERSVIGGRIEVVNELTFSTGSITIREIVFDGTLDDGRSVSVTSEQVSTMDFATGELSPELTFDIAPGVYSDIYFGIELQDESDNPSVIIEGSFTNSNETTVPVRFEFNSGEVFEINDAQVSVNGGMELVGLIAFNPLDWFSVVTATELNAATLTDGVMVISDSSNGNIFDKVADQLDVATEVSIQPI